MRTITCRCVLTMLCAVLLLGSVVPASAATPAAQPAAILYGPAADKLAQPGCGTGASTTFDLPLGTAPGVYVRAWRIFYNTCEANVLVQQFRESANQAGRCVAGGGTVGGVLGFLTSRIRGKVAAIASLILAGTCAERQAKLNSIANKISEINTGCGTLGISFEYRSEIHPDVGGVRSPNSRILLDSFQCQPVSGNPSEPGKATGTPSSEIALNPVEYDYAFVIDTTGSMGTSINSVKASATSIVNNIASKGYSWRASVIVYKDFGDAYVSRIDLGFSSDKTAVINAINAISVGGGGDTPEAVFSGLMTGIKLPWRANATKSIILMGDAPPKDPEPNTGYTRASVIAAANVGGVGVASGKGNGMAAPLAQTTAPAPSSIYSVVIGSDATTITAFRDLSTKTGGAFFQSTTGSDAGSQINGAIDNASLWEDAYDETVEWYSGTSGTMAGFVRSNSWTRTQFSCDSDSAFEYAFYFNVPASVDRTRFRWWHLNSTLDQNLKNTFGTNLAGIIEYNGTPTAYLCMDERVDTLGGPNTIRPELRMSW